MNGKLYTGKTEEYIGLESVPAMLILCSADTQNTAQYITKMPRKITELL